MAVKKKFSDKPLQVPATEVMKSRIKAIADAEDISQAQVIRELLDAGIDAREADSPVSRQLALPA